MLSPSGNLTVPPTFSQSANFAGQTTGWGGKAWNLSGTSRDEVRDWGQVVLSFADRPLIVAGEYGEGRVVWSGMNFIGHAQYLGVNQDELQLFGNLIRWALRGKTGQDLTPPIVIRDH